MAALAEQERADPRATPGRVKGSRGGSRPGSGRDDAKTSGASSGVSKAPESAGKPRLPDAAAARARGGERRARSAPRRSAERTRRAFRRGRARDGLRVADDEARRDVSGVRAEADAREYRRRRDDQSRRVHIRRMVAEEAEKSVRRRRRLTPRGGKRFAPRPRTSRWRFATRWRRCACDATRPWRPRTKPRRSSSPSWTAARRRTRRACGGRAATSTSCCGACARAPRSSGYKRGGRWRRWRATWRRGVESCSRRTSARCAVFREAEPRRARLCRAHRRERARVRGGAREEARGRRRGVWHFEDAPGDGRR